MTLARCVAAIETACGVGDEVIVVKDELLPGPTGARNYGAIAAAHSVLVFVDSDVEIKPAALSLIRRRFASDPKLAAVLGLCALNWPFHRLLARRGRRQLVGGIGLHVVHHLTCVLAALVGVAGMARPTTSHARLARSRVRPTRGR